jgi:predicted metal-dependent HD superfamily phosphohydrolase
MSVLHTSWERVWRGLGSRSEGLDIRDNLISRYSEPHRKYHTLQHLAECIAWFESIPELAQHPEEVEAALWFHDAIYAFDRRDNEKQSALLAHDALTNAGVSKESVARIERLVLVTTHTEPPLSIDEQLVADIDLAILGASEQRFSEYERQIRDEYAFVPDDLFKRERRNILNSFLTRKVIYYSGHFHSLLEAPARSNILRAIAANGG